MPGFYGNLRGGGDDVDYDDYDDSYCAEIEDEDRLHKFCGSV